MRYCSQLKASERRVLNVMKNKNIKWIITIIITISLCAAVFGTIVSADNVLYVNPNGETISSLKGLYVLGGSGTAGVLTANSVWAMTASGLENIGGDGSGTGGGGYVTPEAPPTGTIAVPVSTVRIGLDYYYSASRNSSLAFATLDNYIGSGFAFGYYDSNRTFHELGRTGKTALTIVVDRNTTVSGVTIGCYHVKLPGTYADYDSAAAAASAYTGGFPAYYNGTFYVLVGNYNSATAAAEALNYGIYGEVFTASDRCVAVVERGTNKILFEYDCGTSSSLAVRPLSANGKAVTEYNDGNRYYGDFEFTRYKGLNMTVVNVLPIEDYVKGVVPYEMSSSWPLEALKAQACCARTYMVSNYKSYNSFGFDVTDDTYCQAYLGTKSANATTDRAVDETAGLYITYGGQFCNTTYFSSDGGATEDSENVFSSVVPYLRGVVDPFEDAIDFTYKTWTKTMTAAQITTRLRNYGYSISTVVSVVPEYTRMGNMAKITFRDVNGKTITVSKSNCYSVLGLNSIRFTIEKTANGDYLIKGGGWGHNVGMSQWGAYSMASVYGYSYAEILGFYYTGITISKGIPS